MEDINFNDTLLSVLRNIELNTAQQTSTPQNVDNIIPLTMNVNGRANLTDNIFTVTELSDAVRSESFLFPIPAETPYLIVPETKRSLAFYRDSETVPFAFVNAGQTRSFRLPHLQQLRVDVLPSGDAATIVLYASSRPYETTNNLRASGYYSAIASKTLTAGNVYYSPVISVVDALGVAFHVENSAADAGITSVDITPVFIDDRALAAGESVARCLGGITNPIVFTPTAGILDSTRNVIGQPSRYMLFQVVPQGPGTVSDFFLDYAFVS